MNRDKLFYVTLKDNNDPRAKKLTIGSWANREERMSWMEELESKFEPFRLHLHPFTSDPNHRHVRNVRLREVSEVVEYFDSVSAETRSLVVA